MLSRALSLATVTLLISCLAAIPVRAQNLDAGKSPSQIFSGTCTACHKGARGLLKTVAPGSLPGFLRQHYTTSGEMAAQLSAFLIANGATDNRGAKQAPPTQQAKDARPAAPEQLDRFGRPVRPGQAPAPEAARPDGEPQQAAIAPAPDNRKSTAKQKLSKRGEPPKVDAAKDEAAKTEAPKDDTKSETAAKEAPNETAKEAAKDDVAKPNGEANSQSAHIAVPKENGETPALRSDPVPAVTPAPPAMSAAVSSGTSEPSATPAPPLMMLPPPPAKTASGPPVPPAGPPAPPISQ